MKNGQILKEGKEMGIVGLLSSFQISPPFNFHPEGGEN